MVRKQCPEVPNGSVRMVNHGQNNLVMLLDGRIVFRLARYPEGAILLQRTHQMLRALDGALPLPTPKPVWAYFDLGGRSQLPGGAWLAYPALPGDPLWPTVLAALDTHLKGKIAQSLANFLYALHQVSLPDEIEIPYEDTERWEALYRDLQRFVFPLLSVMTQRGVRWHFDQGLSLLKKEGFRPALIHGDFGSSNILWDPETQELSGIIDFDGLAWGDPALDLAALLASYGEEFINQQCFSGFRRDFPRMRFYHGTFALQEALFGVRNGDGAALAAGLDTIQTQFES